MGILAEAKIRILQRDFDESSLCYSQQNLFVLLSYQLSSARKHSESIEN